jgi:hypothetical protein
LMGERGLGSKELLLGLALSLSALGMVIASSLP